MVCHSNPVQDAMVGFISETAAERAQILEQYHQSGLSQKE